MPIRIGASRCLLGDRVRYDGQHKRDRYVTDVLGKYFEFVAVCPEVEIGMPIPRPPIRLVRIGGDIRVRGVRDPSADYTELLDGHFAQVADTLAGIRGYILKRGSPSCGMERVKIYDEDGVTVDYGVGRFAKALMEARPTLPVEEEGRLNDARLRDNFVTRVFAYDRWRTFVGHTPTVGGLQEFHARHKMLLLAHNQAGYRRLGPLVAAARSDSLGETLCTYEEGFMTTLTRKASPRSHANVLQHLAGHLKHNIDADCRTELQEIIARYRRELVPLVVPLTLLRHPFRRHPKPWVQEQVYLDPHPHELMLHNRV
jgi:uncharacterized protein YbgA (DUF1722 family)/uncharacterized protein YbbK (DUF523 family)